MDPKIAWAAGIAEGEGSFSYKTRILPSGKINYHPQFVLGMNDRDIVERFQKALGLSGKIYKKTMQDPKWGQTWVISVGDRNEFLRIVDLLLPWLGPRKQNQIDMIYDKMSRSEGYTTGRLKRPYWSTS